MADVKDYKPQVTTNYDKFSRLIANRSTQRTHVNNLKIALQEHPEIIEAQPILVNEKFQIIDGQHRFEAATELGMPIYYTMVPGIGIETARMMNVLQKAWKPEDFAKSYAVTGNKHYQEYLRARDDFELGHNVTMLALGTLTDRGIYQTFKRGEWEVNDLARGREWLTRLGEYGHLMTIPMSRNLALAFFQVFKNENFDHKRMLQKLREVGPDYVIRQGTHRDYLRHIEEVYNFHMQVKARLFD